MSNVKIAIVDDHPVLRTGIRQIIEDEENLTVCGEAASADDAIKIIHKESPHLVLVDISLAGSADGIDLVKSVKERFPSVKTLILSMHDESIYAERALKAGARGYLKKEVASKNIIEAIDKIMNGGLYLSETVSEKIIEKMMHKSGSDSLETSDTLSNREFEIFQLIGRGFTAKEIAQKLNLSINTVDTHKKNIKSKMGIEESSDLLKKAIQWVIENNG